MTLRSQNGPAWKISHEFNISFCQCGDELLLSTATVIPAVLCEKHVASTSSIFQRWTLIFLVTASFSDDSSDICSHGFDFSNWWRSWGYDFFFNRCICSWPQFLLLTAVKFLFTAPISALNLYSAKFLRGSHICLLHQLLWSVKEIHFNTISRRWLCVFSSFSPSNVANWTKRRLAGCSCLSELRSVSAFTQWTCFKSSSQNKFAIK